MRRISARDTRRERLGLVLDQMPLGRMLVGLACVVVGCTGDADSRDTMSADTTRDTASEVADVADTAVETRPETSPETEPETTVVETVPETAETEPETEPETAEVEVAARCGDGQQDPGEACDQGAANSDSTPDACRTDCTLARCGDHVKDSNEACDDGNSVEHDGCDRSCHAADVVPAPAAGAVVIDELMVASAAVPDVDGEWIELRNVSTGRVNLGDCELVDDGTDRIVLGEWLLEPGAFLVVGRNAAMAKNGGVNVAQADDGMLLDDVADEVILRCPRAASAVAAPAWTTIDRVAWSAFAWPIVAGRALQLDPSRADATFDDVPEAWCAATTRYGKGDRGTPGAPNTTCPQLDDRVDACRLVTAAVDVFPAIPVSLAVDVTEPSITDVTEGPDPSALLTVEVGWGSVADPVETWTWTPAAVASAGAGPDSARSDQYVGPIEVTGTAPGVQVVRTLGRASRDGGKTWLYCDDDGSDNGLALASSGTVTLLANPCTPSSCTDAPASVCDEDAVHRRSYDAVGVCIPKTSDTFTCTYPARVENCGDEGLACSEGACGDVPRGPALGEIAFTELMLEPTVGASGQWVELRNLVGEPLSLTGCIFETNAGTTPVTWTIDVPAVIGKGSTLVLGASVDGAANGGAAVGLGWPPDFALPSAVGTLVLTCGAMPIDEFTWSSGTWSATAGVAMALSPYKTTIGDNDDPAAWCRASASYGTGDRGTPGATNPPCPGDLVPVDLCRVIGQASSQHAAGTTITSGVRLVAAAITGKTKKTDVSARVSVAVAVVPRGVTPAADTAWTVAKADASWNASGTGIDPAEDRYIGTLVVHAPGEWDIWARATADAGQTVVVCDLNGVVRAGQTPAPQHLDSVAGACFPAPCLEAPPIACKGTKRVSYDAPGNCALATSGPEPFACTYGERTLEDCATAGAVCEGGACTHYPRRPLAGELVVSELMIAPSKGEDREWFEVSNVATEPLDLAGCELRSGPAEVWPLPASTELLHWVVPVGQTLVFARSTYVSPRDATWSGLALANDADWLQVACGDAIIDTVAWDRDDGWSVTNDVLSLAPDRLDGHANDFAGSWCATGDGNPDAPNLACPDEDGLIDDCRVIALADSAPVGGLLAGQLLVLDLGVSDVGPDTTSAYGLRVALGVGPAGADPRTSFAYAWDDATPDEAWLDSAEAGWTGWDRWLASPRMTTFGDAVLVGKVSVDNGKTWTFCDATPLADGFTVAEAPPVDGLASACAPDPCPAQAESRCGGFGVYGEFVDSPCSLNGVGNAVCDLRERYFSCTDFGEACTAMHTCPQAPAAPTHPGDLVITEIMRNSTLPAPDPGEWLEITNAASGDLDLASCVLSNASGQATSLKRIVPSLLGAGYEAVLVHSFDSTDNGGMSEALTNAYELGDVALGDRDDVLSLTCGGILIDQVAYAADWPGAAGVAMQLSRTHTSAAANDARAAWCVSYSTYGSAGNHGSPAWQNSVCP